MGDLSPAEVYEKWSQGLRDDALARRNERIATLRTPQDVLAWAADLRAWYRQQVGPLVGSAKDLRREFHGRIERQGYHVEKWLFEVMPGTFSSANLYVPAKPHAAGVGIVAALGHWAEGKAYADYQNLGAFMAYNGVTVLVYDHFGVGEMLEFWNPVRGESRTGKSPTSEHNRTGDIATLAGIQPVRPYLTAAARAKDFLASFKFVRRDRIGITGASGGATLSRFAAAYLDDLAFAIPCCIIRGEEIGGGGDAEQCCWNAGTRGVSPVDLLAAMLPRPVMIIAETSFEATGRSYATLRRLYDLAGAGPGVTECVGIDDIHGYTHPMIEAAYRFLARQFALPPPDPETWPHIRLLEAAQTRITRSGCLVRERLQMTYLQQIKRNTPPPAGLTAEKLPGLLRIADLSRSPAPYALRGEVGKTVRVTGWTTSGEGELGLADFPPTHPPSYYLGDNILYCEGDPCEARFLMHFDRCLIGLRVRQILDFLEDHQGKVETLESDGPWSVPVAFAAALAGPRLLKGVKLRYLPRSFREFFDADLNSTSLGAMAPGLLTLGDIDDVLALSGGRVTVLFRVDAEGRVVSEA